MVTKETTNVYLIGKFLKINRMKNKLFKEQNPLKEEAPEYPYAIKIEIRRVD